MICMAVLPSDTFAHKAQRILTANGYKTEMIRTTTREDGCIFGIRIYGKLETIKLLLEQERIPVKSLRIERDNT
ncbi:MAG: hypothetical protein K2O52_01375 [Oscillospiraceae bacterium]|nr:hypothetical protein [Ruminococcus sp.]MDE5737584.1 hypothetical protein [Oscillospiraceae bacterium]MDE6707532.1 hypothetical protein [Oscillospiraceae bacterium]MDE6777508.1 hypothetical protein [Oscillospiraceae bacterium]MDE7093542.1 hypothetical protein [Oscillospiraceae bacterium]